MNLTRFKAIAMLAEGKVTDSFCIADDFCRVFNVMTGNMVKRLFQTAVCRKYPKCVDDDVCRKVCVLNAP